MKILVVSPHPDDETLGAGGTLIKMKKNGHQIFWLNITDMKPEYGWSEEVFVHRQEQIHQICGIYHFNGFFNLGLPPTRLNAMDEGEIISKIHEVFEEVKPEWLIIPGNYDAHSDHRTVYNCCMAAAKAFRAPYIRRISTMEIISETEYGFQKVKFEPNLFIDITDEIEDKIKAIRVYDTEIEEGPFPRSIDNIMALAKFRGGSCLSGYAEAFVILKQLEE